MLSQRILLFKSERSLTIRPQVRCHGLGIRCPSLPQRFELRLEPDSPRSNVDYLSGVWSAWSCSLWRGHWCEAVDVYHGNPSNGQINLKNQCKSNKSNEQRLHLGDNLIGFYRKSGQATIICLSLPTLNSPLTRAIQKDESHKRFPEVSTRQRGPVWTFGARWQWTE
jgi:hypothetical protein